MIQVTINGEPRELPPGLTIAMLLETLGVREERVAVERNRSVVKRGTRAQVPVEPGDQIEIVSFVGGG